MGQVSVNRSRGKIDKIELTCDAEMRVAESDPKFYLKNGAAKVLMGDYYNTEDPKNETVYNIDNTITHHSNADDLSFQPPTVERLDSDNAEAISQHIDQEKLFEVLSVLRENGQDINQLVDDRMKQIKLQDSARKN